MYPEEWSVYECAAATPRLYRLWHRSPHVLGGFVVAVIVVATATMLCTAGGASLYEKGLTPKKHERPDQPPRALSVELLRRYSNRDDLLKPLVRVLERIKEEQPVGHEEAQLSSADGPAPRAWQISRRLTPADIKALVAAYLGGSTIKVLAEQYTISTTSVKRLLREHGARKQRPRSAA